MNGDVHLILADDCQLAVNGGIEVEDDDEKVDNGSPNALTIYAQSTNESEMGSLTATASGEYKAGIGADGGEYSDALFTGGTITINGGYVTASAENGAGIGGSRGNFYKNFAGGAGGTITVNGGIVVATSTNSAGIGGGSGGSGYLSYTGNNCSAGGAGGKITINGGTVRATGGGGAGIGGGNGNSGGAGGTIAITSGEVTANGSKGGAGIGGAGGISHNNDRTGAAGGAGGTITISDGTVTATGSNVGHGVGAGIGGGAGSDGSYYWGGTGGNGGTIIISGGTVTATSGSSPYYADIGGGRGGYGRQGGQKPEAIADKIEIATNVIVKNGSGDDAKIGQAHGPNTRSWRYDGEGHWHPCGVSGCPDTDHQSQKEAHNFEWQDNEYGHWKECVACGYMNGGEDHRFGAWQTDGQRHWRACTVCGRQELGDHSADQTICGEPQHCSVCGYQMTAALAHDWSEWVSNNDGTHHRTCQRDKTHTETVSCSGDAATCDTAQICSICGYQIMAALGHDYGDLIPLKEATTTSTGMKAHYLCARCGNYFDEGKNPTTGDALTIPKKEHSGGGDNMPVITYHTLTFDTGGGSTIDKVRVQSGKTIDLSEYAPTREGYTFDGWYADAALTEKIERVKLTKDTIIYAGWTQQEPEPTPSVSDIFNDVAPDAWFVDVVQFAYDKGIMTGTSAATFSPELTTTRAMIVAMLQRLEGNPTAESAGFADVADGDWYADAVNWAASEGIASGMSETSFAPNDPITREQLAAILHNYAAYKGLDTSARADLSRYSDASSISDWAGEVMQWAVGESLISGMTSESLSPQGEATRAQVAAIFERFLGGETE